LKRLTARGPAFVIALIVLFVALGGSAYAMSSSTAKVNAPVHKLRLKVVTKEATPPQPDVKPASFTG
jgi:predicted component of type VI protein secretion system